jgi:hypothetical protein
MAIVLSQMEGRGGFELSTYSLNVRPDVFSPNFSKPRSVDKNILETMY